MYFRNDCGLRNNVPTRIIPHAYFLTIISKTAYVLKTYSLNDNEVLKIVFLKLV